jgi:hypothetical protein
VISIWRVLKFSFLKILASNPISCCPFGTTRPPA